MVLMVTAIELLVKLIKLLSSLVELTLSLSSVYSKFLDRIHHSQTLSRLVALFFDHRRAHIQALLGCKATCALV